MYDTTNVLAFLRLATDRVNESCQRGELDKAAAWCDRAVDEYNTTYIYVTSNIPDRYEREKVIALLRRDVTKVVLPLLRAYGQQGCVEEAVNLFREITAVVGATAKTAEERALAREFSTSQGMWNITDIAMPLFQQNESAPLLERIVALCYGVILADSGLVRQYGDSTRLGYRIQAAEQMSPGDSFAKFVASYKALAEIYQEDELREAASTFHEKDDVWRRTAEVRALAERYRDETLRRQFIYAIATTLAESILYYGKGGNYSAADNAYIELKDIVGTHVEEDDELVYVKGKGAANIIYMLIESGRPDDARTVYEELRKIAEEGYLKKPNLLVRQTAGRASEIIYAYAKQSRFAEAMTMYGELAALAEEYPDEPQLRVWQANGALDLSYWYLSAGMLNEAKSMCRQLEKLAADLENLPDVEKRNIDERTVKYNIADHDGIPAIDWLRKSLGDVRA